MSNISIVNSLDSNAFGKKTWTSVFLKDVQGRAKFERLAGTQEGMFLQIAGETMLSLVNNIKGNVQDKNIRNSRDVLCTYIVIAPLTRRQNFSIRR